jgi:hypothetical protein
LLLLVLALDGQTDSVKKYRIRLSVVNPSAVLWLGTTLDGQTDSVKKYRIRLSAVNPSADRWLGTTLDGQTDSVKKYRLRLSVVNPYTAAAGRGWLSYHYLRHSNVTRNRR